MQKTRDDALRGGGQKKKSIASQKADKAEAKRKSDIQLKIKKADKNFKLFLSEVKKILEKHEEDTITQELQATVAQARYCETKGNVIRFLYLCQSEFQGRGR